MYEQLRSLFQNLGWQTQESDGTAIVFAEKEYRVQPVAQADDVTAALLVVDDVGKRPSTRRSLYRLATLQRKSPLLLIIYTESAPYLFWIWKFKERFSALPQSPGAFSKRHWLNRLRISDVGNEAEERGLMSTTLDHLFVSNESLRQTSDSALLRGLATAEKEALALIRNMAHALSDAFLKGESGQLSDIKRIHRALHSLYDHIRLSRRLAHDLLDELDWYDEMLKGARVGATHADDTPSDSQKKETRRPSSSTFNSFQNYRCLVLEAIIKMGGRASTEAVFKYIREQMSRRSGMTNIANVNWERRVHQERAAMIKAGLLKAYTPFGIWAVTDLGQQFYASRCAQARERVHRQRYKPENLRPSRFSRRVPMRARKPMVQESAQEDE